MRKKNEHFLLQTQKITEQHFAKIFEFLPGRAYIKDRNGIYLMCNEQLAKDLGFSSSKDLIGKTDYDLSTKEQADRYRKSDLRVMDSGEPLLLEEPITHANGDPAIYRTRKIPLRDENNKITAIFVISDDVTTERFKRLMKNTQEHFYWKNKEGVYLDCNDAVAKAAGFESAQEIVGKTDYDIFSKEGADILRAIDLRIMTTGIPEILEEPGVRNDGSLGLFWTSKFPSFDMDGNIDSIMGFSNDITAQKHAEIAKSDFISNMQHDLRTPFAGISAIAMLLFEMETDPNKKLLLEELLKSCNQWETVHHQIIAALSIKEPQTIKKEWVSISSELNKIRESLLSTLRIKALDFFIDPIPEKLDKIETDRLKLNRILSNLVGNAIKFTEKGSVKVTVTYGKAACKIKVIDTGIGIPSDKLEYIFEQFTKLSNSNKHKDFMGIGLGLYSSRRIAIELGGNIQVKSKLGEGSTFIITLPIQDKSER